MSKVYAHRDLKICSKDCLCLFVCPTGATNNETGQIDKDTCIGCGACASACPAHAITLLPRKLPPEQAKNKEVLNALKIVITNKIKELATLRNLIELEEDETVKKFVGTYRPEHYLLNEKEPIAVGPLDVQSYLFEHKAQQAEAMRNAKQVILDVAKDFEKMTGRKYSFFDLRSFKY